MKKKILSLLFSTMFILPILLFSACGNDNNNNSTVNTISLSFMKDLMVDTSGVTAYGIKKSQQDNQSHVSTVSLLSEKVVNNDNGRKNNSKFYLYKTTENYEYGNVEYDENKITKVTFKKNTTVSEEIYDNEGNLIDSSTIITQDDLDGKINKVYTTKQFTYLQFVADVEGSGYYNYYDSNNALQTEYVSLRPNSLTFDENGVAEFDKTDYFSSNLTASFVIDNETGYIYKIDGFYIKSFKNNLVLDENGYYYSVKTDEESNLVFTDIMPNKDVEVYYAMIDNYGWTFIYNNMLDIRDESNKIICFTSGKEFIADYEGNVYKVEYYPQSLIEHLAKIFINGKETDIENNSLIKLKSLTDGWVSYSHDLVAYYNGLDIYQVASNFVIRSNEGFKLEIFNCYDWNWFDNNFCEIITIQNKNIYYYSVNIADYISNTKIISVEKDFTKLSDMQLTCVDNYYLKIGNDLYKQTNIYKSVDINETEYYKLVKDVDGLTLVKLEAKEYTNNIFVFQPINK